MPEHNGHLTDHLPNHLTDEQLLLAADGESAEAQQHLRSCPQCRMRMQAAQTAVAEFAHLNRATLDPQIPPADDARSRLQAQLSSLAPPPVPKSRQQSWRSEFPALKIACAAALLCVAGFAWMHRLPVQLSGITQVVRDPSLPDRRLTPGSFQDIRLQDVCGAAPYEQARVTSLSLKQEVLREYGMPGADPSKYEIDYLVIPELGGTNDIRNLWPEPYSSTVWNAHVKDELEEQLHQLVCEQKLDLKTAQHDIAVDWIAAYKKYFHTDRPVLLSSASSAAL